MFKKIFDIVKSEFSGVNAKEIVGGIATFHRIQSSPGFRAAAKYCHDKVVEYGIPCVEILSYPAKGNNLFWGCPIPKEWSVKHASLDLIDDSGSIKKLCRFYEDPCSIIQRSKATPKEGITEEVVILPKGLDEYEMESYNIKGKFILTDDPDLKKLRHVAINKLGALGIIYDLVTEIKPLRTRANFPTARRYTSFWYGEKGDEGDALGFVLSAEKGEELRNLIVQNQKENEKLKKEGKSLKKIQLHATIDADFYDGEMEVLEFFIPGEIEGKEVLAVAHICHPKPGAVDNASGCGTLIEVARTLKELITQGKLPKPKTGIRFLLMAEFTGTYCYLATHEDKINDFIAGLNLDMIGADQTFGGRTLVMERTHCSMPSFVNDVLSSILEEASKEIKNFQNTGAFATFSYANDQPFSGGSDHHLLGSPDVGIGTPMIIQWPDKYYHTSEDTIEKVSHEMLHLVGTLATTYCYFIANASLSDIYWTIGLVGSKGRERITAVGRNFINKITTALQEKENNEKDRKERIFYGLKKQLESTFNFRQIEEVGTLESIKKLVSKKEDLKFVSDILEKEKDILINHTKNELERTHQILLKIAASLNLTLEKLENREQEFLPEQKYIIQKNFKGPISSLYLTDLSYEEEKEYNSIIMEHKGMTPIITTAMFWVDGKRSIEEISRLVEAEHGITSLPFLIKIMKFYEKHKILRIIEKRNGEESKKKSR